MTTAAGEAREEDGDDPLVLHVDDEEGIVDLAETFLEREGLAVVTATDADSGMDLLEEESIDCVVSDYDMPGTDGLEFLATVREEYPDLPFILFTGKGSEEIASEAISRGVTDYLQKETGTDQYAVLAHRIQESVRRYRAESELAEARRKYRTLLANLPGVAYRATTEEGWPMMFVSEGARELTGYDPEELTSGALNWEQEVIVEEDREPVRRAVDAALERGEPFEVTYGIRTADGDRRTAWEQGRAVEETEDGHAILEGFITDVTERERNERRLRIVSATQRAVLQHLTDGVLVADPEDGDLLETNPAAATMTGYDEATLAASDLQTVLEPADSTVEDLVQAAEDTFERELVFGGPDGDTSAWTVRGCTLEFDEQDRLVLVLERED